jgi:Mg2+-importing ATPase
VASLPRWPLLIATGLIAVVTLTLPYLPLGAILGFSPLPASCLFILILIVGSYMLTTELAKHVFYTRVAQ